MRKFRILTGAAAGMVLTLRDAAYELLVSPRDLDLRLCRAGTQDLTDVAMPSAFNDVVIHRHHDLRTHR